MYPVLETPWFAIHTYGVVLAIALALGFELGARKSAAWGDDPRDFARFASLTAVACLLGARAVYVAARWGDFAARPADALMFWRGGGFSSLGALLGALLVAGPVAALHPRLRPLRLTDLGVCSVALFLAVARLGCLANGCCRGAPTALPWGVDLGAGPLHPAALYAFLSFFVLWRVLEGQWARYRSAAPGWTTLVFAYWLAAHRVVLDGVRAPDAATVAGMSLGRAGALVIGLGALAAHAALRRRGGWLGVGALRERAGEEPDQEGGEAPGEG